MGDVAGPYLFKRFGEDRAAFEKAVIEALGETDGKRLRIDAVEPILAYEEAAREAALAGEETPSIADIFVASVVAVATKRYGCTGGEEENSNALQTWLASLWRRPSFQKHLDFLLTAWM